MNDLLVIFRQFIATLNIELENDIALRDLVNFNLSYLCFVIFIFKDLICFFKMFVIINCRYSLNCSSNNETAWVAQNLFGEFEKYFFFKKGLIILFFRYNNFVYAHLLYRYCEHKYRNKRKAQRKYHSLVEMLNKIEISTRTMLHVFTNEVEHTLLADILLDILGIEQNIST